MRQILRLTLPALVICLLVGNVAFAQGRGGFGGFQMGGPMLLMNEQVQKELKITDEQKTKIGEVLQTLRPPEGTNPFQLQGAEREAYFAEMQKKSEAAGKKIDAEVLNPEQVTRFKQVELWVQGSRALATNAELAKELNLTDDQKGAIKTIVDESDKKIGQLRQSAFGQGVSDEDRTKAREQMATMRNETDAECMAVLTDDQQAKLTKMKGPKFQLDMSQLGPRRGRGGQ
jgi:Spy/CpxP family protein refolding chaperone